MKMVKLNIKQYFGGKRTLDTINGILRFVILYATIIIFMTRPQYFLWFVIPMAFVLLIYGNWYQHKLRTVAESRKGVRSVEGWTTHGYKFGERHYYDPVRFELKDRLSPASLTDIQNFIDIQTEHSKSLETETGLERFRQKQISYKEVAEKNSMDNEERLKIEAEEKEEYKGYMKDYDIMNAQKQSKKVENGGNIDE